MRMYLAVCAVLVAWATSVGAAPSILGDYYEDRAYANCATSSPYCSAFFSATPAGKLLTITNVSCSLLRTQPHVKASLAISNSMTPDANRSIHLPVTATAIVDVSGWYVNAFAEQVRFLVGPNKYPFVHSTTMGSSGGTLECTITGTLTNQ